MVAYVAQVGSSEQCVADGMNEHVGIAMAQQPQLMLYLDASPREGLGVGLYLLNKSLMPSMSNDRVKRSVWSSGLLFAVAMT